MQQRGIADLLAWGATALAAVATAAGLFAGGLYRDVPFWAQQARGIDLATLVLAVPILVCGLWSARRGSGMARLMVVGGLLYLVYNYLIYTTSVAMNRLALVYIAILGLSVWSLVLGLSTWDLPKAAVPILDRLPRRASAGLLLVVAALFGLLWLSQIAAFTTTGNLPADLKKAGLPANPVYALDLGIFLPLAVVAAVGLLRRHRVGAAFAVPMFIWIFLTSAGIVGGFVFEASTGQEVSVAVAALVGGVGIIAASFAALPMLRARLRTA